MSTIAARIPVSRRARLSSRAQALVAAGLTPAAAHMLDVSSAGELLAAAPFVAAAIAYVLLFPSLPRPVAAWTAFTAGALAVADGGVHATQGYDVLGIATGLGGIALLAAALATTVGPWTRRRWLAAAGATVVVPLTIVLLVVPLYLGIYWLHGPAPEAAQLAIPHDQVRLVAADGVALPAQWVPSRNGSAVIVVHGSAGHAELLARNGYGVVMLEPRQADGPGWSWYRDIWGAISFLEERGFDRIGALGADSVLDAASRDRRLDAVVVDEASTIDGPLSGLSEATFRVLSGESPPEPPLVRIAHPTMLGAADERRVVAFFDANL